MISSAYMLTKVKNLDVIENLLLQEMLLAIVKIVPCVLKRILKAQEP